VFRNQAEESLLQRSFSARPREGGIHASEHSSEQRRTQGEDKGA
jgi:hypothetical protein